MCRLGVIVCYASRAWHQTWTRISNQDQQSDTKSDQKCMASTVFRLISIHNRSKVKSKRYEYTMVWSQKARWKSSKSTCFGSSTVVLWFCFGYASGSLLRVARVLRCFSLFVLRVCFGSSTVVLRFCFGLVLLNFFDDRAFDWQVRIRWTSWLYPSQWLSLKNPHIFGECGI